MRTACNGDGPQVEALVGSVLREYGLALDPEGVDRDLSDLEGHYLSPGGHFEVVENAAGDLIGSMGLMPLGDGVCELRKLYLAPAARGQGLGKRLLERAIHRARELGFFRMELETAGVLKEAIALYRRYGFLEKAAAGCCRCDRAFYLDL